LAQLRSPADRPRPSGSPLSVARWCLNFLYLGPLRACAELRPSRRIAARGMRSLSPSSIGYCQPSVARRPEMLPTPERSDPTAAWPLRPPGPCPSGICYSRTTAQAGSPPTDKWKRPASGQEVDQDKEQSALQGNPVGRLESAVPPHSQPPAKAPGLVVRMPVKKPAQVVQSPRR